jgi:hypothetical protein
MFVLVPQRGDVCELVCPVELVVTKLSKQAPTLAGSSCVTKLLKSNLNKICPYMVINNNFHIISNFKINIYIIINRPISLNINFVFYYLNNSVSTLSCLEEKLV